MALLRRRRSAPSTGRESDAQTLRRLEALGAKLSRARHVIHFLSFVEQGDARSAAEAIERAGWESTVTAPETASGLWEVRGEGERVVDDTTVGAFRSWFERIAGERNGTYDGWEAAAKP
jgi:hypothetical protein